MLSNVIRAYDDTIELMIPEEFEEIAPDHIKGRFKNNKPDVLYEHKTNKAMITLTKSDSIVFSDDVESRLSEYYIAYQRSVAGFANSKLAIKTLEGDRKIGTFHYTSTSIDRDWLNFFVLLEIEGKEAVITLHCFAEDSPLLGIKFMQVLNSIRYLQESSFEKEP